MHRRLYYREIQGCYASRIIPTCQNWWRAMYGKMLTDKDHLTTNSSRKILEYPSKELHFNDNKA